MNHSKKTIADNEISDWFETYRYLLLVARSILQFPTVQQKMSEEYSKNKFLYYNTAKENENCNEFLMPKGRIEDVIIFRQNIGILLVAKNNEDLRMQVVEHLCNAHPKIKTYINKPNENDNFAKAFVRNLNPELRDMGLLYIVSYVSIYSNSSVDDANMFVIFAKASIETFSSVINEYEEPKPWTNAEACVELKFSKDEWQLIKSIKGGETISRYCTAFRQSMFPNKPEDLPELVEYPTEVNGEVHAAFSSAVFSLLLANNLNWEDLFGDLVITKKDRIKILQKSADFGDACGGYKPIHYLISMTIYLLAKRIFSMNEYFLAHDAEEKTLEMQHRIEENTDLQKLLTLLKSENEKLKTEITVKEKQIRNEYSVTTRADNKQISILTQKNRELENQLAESRKSLTELELLRNYALSESDEKYRGTGQQANFSELLQSKRYIVVGGHINWRNKLKNRFPNLSVIDGTNTASDLKIFDNADYVYFYTAHMSHKSYERIINYVKSKEIPYGFLHPTTNNDILDKQLCDLALQ